MRGSLLFVSLFAVLGFTQSFAQNVPTFNVNLRGSVGSFYYTSPTDGVARNILYYFPRSIADVKKGAAPRKTLVFLHGGGESTATDAGATDVAKMYIQDFLNYAEQRQVILIFPTTSFGWNAHTPYFLKNFLTFAETQIAIDDDHLLLSGHSMGGMGITREYPNMTDLFSGVLGLSAGTQTKMLIEDLVVPYLNGTPYVHINGNDDHFTDFKPLMIAFRNRLTEIETKYQRKSAFELIFRPGGHDYELNQALAVLDRLFLNKKIRSPKFFEARFNVVHLPANAQNPAAFPKIEAKTQQVYWLKLDGITDPGPGKAIQANVLVTVTNQNVGIVTHNDTLKASQAIVSLDPNLVNMSLPVSVTYNGVPIYKGPAQSAGGPLKLSTRQKVKM